MVVYLYLTNYFYNITMQGWLTSQVQDRVTIDKTCVQYVVLENWILDGVKCKNRYRILEISIFR